MTHDNPKKARFDWIDTGILRGRVVWEFQVIGFMKKWARKI